MEQNIISKLEQNMTRCIKVMDQVLKYLEEINEEKQTLVAKSTGYKVQIEQLN